MNQSFNLKTTAVAVRNWIGRAATGRVFLLLALMLVWFVLSPRMQAQCPTLCDANNNTAVGENALLNNTTCNNNTAIGELALQFNNGEENTATGLAALRLNTMGFENTAYGAFALVSNTMGHRNTATGDVALSGNTTGSANTAEGFQALFHNNGSNNIGLGFNAGYNLTLGSHNIDIGNAGVAAESNTIRIGSVQTRAFIKGISGVAIAGATVVVNGGGQLGVAPSSARFKNHIRHMEAESETILALTPVSFCYDQDVDEQSLPQFGLVAEDVEKVNPDLVLRNEEGKPYTVRYDAVNAMLLNEFLKEHKTVQELRSVVAKQEANAVRQQKQIEALTTGLQKVSAQIEASRPVPQVVKNP